VIAGIAWRVGLALIAVLVVGLQIDRESERSPDVAALVPGPFRSSAQPIVTADALADGHAAEALVNAQALLRRRPVPAEHLRLLAEAQIAVGKPAEAAQSIQYAAQRGWRDGTAQEAMMRLALQAGDMPEAARRYTALFLRNGSDDDALEQVGRLVLSEPGGAGRTTFAAIIANSPRWHSRFLNRGAKVLPPDAFDEIFAFVSANGAQFDCSALGSARRKLERRGADGAAAISAVLERRC